MRPRLVRSRPITGGHDYDRGFSSILLAPCILTNYAETGLGLLRPAGATVILVS